MLQLRIMLADSWCNLQQMKIWNQWKDLQIFLLMILTPTRSCKGNLLRDYEHKFEQLAEDQKLSKLCSDAGLKIVEKGQFFITLGEEGPDEMKNLCREYTLPRSEEASRVRGEISETRKSAGSWM